jgi:hypothetical protein
MSYTTEVPVSPTRVRTANGPGIVVCLCMVPVAAWWLSRGAPAWVMMWAIASGEFFALKFLTLRGLPSGLPGWRLASYIFLWPGMKPREFLGLTSIRPPAATGLELARALAKTAIGVVGLAWAIANAFSRSALLVGWVGMLGIIFTLHFGGFDFLSWAWRRLGVAAMPIMMAPLRATSLGEFWGERWNLAFAELARRFILRPLARPLGASLAGSTVFLISGLVHESVLSLPARAGWGRPTLFFLLQALGIVAEKSMTGRRMGLGKGLRGWTWVLLFTVGPISLLFTPVFVERVIVPMFQQLKTFLQ